MSKKNKWTKYEIDYLKENYNKLSAASIAKKLHRPISSVFSKAHALGLKKDKAIFDNPKPNQTSFKKGNKTWNKGTKGLTGANRTSFKKGNVPHNTKQIGEIWIRERIGEKYKWIKTENGAMLLHRHLWEREHGKIPKNHVVIFKDGDSMNCTIENIECISRSEHLKRNSNPAKQSRTMKRKKYNSFFEAVLSGE